MRTISESANYKRSFRASPTFDLEDSRIVLDLYLVLHVRDDEGEWVELAEYKQFLKRVIITNADSIDITTGLYATHESAPENVVPAYNFFMGMSAAQLGMTDLNQMIYGYIANTIETFIEANELL